MRRKKAVVQMKNGKPKAVFASLNTTREYGFDPAHVGKVARGLRNIHGGHQWSYLSEKKAQKINNRKKGKTWKKITKKTIDNYGVTL